MVSPISTANPLPLRQQPLGRSSGPFTCVASAQTSSKVINQIAEDTLALIKLQAIRTNNPTVIIRAKGSTQQPSRKNHLQEAVYDTVQK